MFEKSFLQSARPTLRYISPEFGCRSPCESIISREKKRAIAKMSVSAEQAQMYFFVPGKYRENTSESAGSVICSLICESDCTGLKVSA